MLPLESEGFGSLKSLALESWIRNNILFVEACHRIQIQTDKTNTHYYMKIQKEEKFTEYYFYFQNESEVCSKLLQRARTALNQVEAFSNAEELPEDNHSSQAPAPNSSFQSGLVGSQAHQRFKTTYYHYSKLQKVLKV